MELKNIKVHIALFLVSLFYAILFSWAGEIMPKYIAPGGFVLLRVGVAFLLFNLLVFFTGRKQKIDFKKHGKRLLLCALFGTAFNMLLFFHGLSKTHAINGAVLMMVTPLFVVVIDHIKLRKIPKFLTVLGFVMGSAGAVMLMSGKGISFDAKTLPGDIMVAVNALFYAIYLVLVKDLFKSYTPAQVNGVNFGLGIVFMLPFGFYDLINWHPSAIPPDTWLKIAYILVITTFVVYQLNAYAVKKAGPEIAGLYIYLQPVLAAIIAVLLGTDELNWFKGLSSLVIIAGVFMASYKSKEV